MSKTERKEHVAGVVSGVVFGVISVALLIHAIKTHDVGLAISFTIFGVAMLASAIAQAMLLRCDKSED